MLVPPRWTGHDEVLRRRGRGGAEPGLCQCPQPVPAWVAAECCSLTSDLSVYERNAKLLVSALREMGYTCVEPQGAFYLFLKTLEPDDGAFSEPGKAVRPAAGARLRLWRAGVGAAGLLRPDGDDRAVPAQVQGAGGELSVKQQDRRASQPAGLVVWVIQKHPALFSEFEARHRNHSIQRSNSCPSKQNVRYIIFLLLNRIHWFCQLQ